MLTGGNENVVDEFSSKIEQEKEYLS